MPRLAPPLLVPLALAGALAACDGGSDGAPAPPGTEAVARGAIAPGPGLVVAGAPFSAAGADVVVQGVGGRSPAELLPGRVARVRAVLSEVGADALEVRIEPAVVGRAGRVTVAPLGGVRTMDVRGLPIVLDPLTLVVDRRGSPVGPDAIVPNTDRISVHGFPDEAGRIRATRVEILPGSIDDLALRGWVSGLDAAGGGFDLAVTPGAPAEATLAVVLAADAALPAGVVDGAFVEVRSVTPWVLVDPASRPPVVASSVTLEDPGLGAGAEARVEGIVASGDAAAFAVPGASVVTGGGTTFENGGRDELAPGSKVEVEGTLDPDGVLQARAVAFRPSIRLQDRARFVTASTVHLCGLTVHLDELTRRPATLAPGRTYAVRARPHENGVHLVATRIDDLGDEPEVSVQGPVQSVDRAARTVRVFGVTLDVGAAERIAGLDGVPLQPAAFLDRVAPGTVVRARADGPFPGTPFVPRVLEIAGRR